MLQKYIKSYTKEEILLFRLFVQNNRKKCLLIITDNRVDTKFSIPDNRITDNQGPTVFFVSILKTDNEQNFKIFLDVQFQIEITSTFRSDKMICRVASPDY